MTDVTELVEHPRAAYAAGFEAALAGPSPFFAEEVEIAHVPPAPTDGVKTGTELRGAPKLRRVHYSRSCPISRMTATISSPAPNRVAVAAVLNGTLADGTKFHQDLGLEYLLVGGEIVRSTAKYDPESIAVLRPALAAAFPEIAVEETASNP